MPRPIHFEIHASDPDALGSFYKKVFGWDFHKWGEEPYWLVSTGDGNPMAGIPSSQPGIDGAMLERSGPAPQAGAPISGWVITVGVSDCHRTVAAAVAAGGSLAMPVNPVPGIGWLAYIVDPDGNTFGVLQSDEQAGPPEVRRDTDAGVGQAGEDG